MWSFEDVPSGADESVHFSQIVPGSLADRPARALAGVQMRVETGPAIMATLGNTGVGWHRITGEVHIVRAGRRPNELSKP